MKTKLNKIFHNNCKNKRDRTSCSPSIGKEGRNINIFYIAKVSLKGWFAKFLLYWHYYYITRGMIKFEFTCREHFLVGIYNE